MTSTSSVSEFLLHETIENTLNTAINKVNILFIFNGFLIQCKITKS
nr:MAG TPA: hypothetical protein [Caudoviricetes sp.]